MPRLPLALVALALLGCGDPDGGPSPGSGDTTTTSSTTAMTTATTTSTTVTTSTGATASATGTTTTGDVSDSSTGAAESTGAGPSSSGDSGDAETGTGSCAPSAKDDDCRTCVKAACCDVWAFCAADEICSCTIDCHLGGGSLGSCKNQCGGENELYQAVYFCGQQSCLNTCDWDCC